MRTLVVGTGNQHKVGEISAILKDLPIRVKSAQALPSIPEVEETGDTFEANAHLKAMEFARVAMDLPPAQYREECQEDPDDSQSYRPDWILSDDSGLCVDALDGRPGVYSARYAASPDADSPNSTDNNLKLLQEMCDISKADRGAHFVCVVALVEVPMENEMEPNLLFSLRGECHGLIIQEERGTGGFGYDPVFFVPELGKTFAEITAQEKNKISHRAMALEKFRRKMEEIIQ